jgi:hypothetical protein
LVAKLTFGKRDLPVVRERSPPPTTSCERSARLFSRWPLGAPAQTVPGPRGESAQAEVARDEQDDDDEADEPDDAVHGLIPLPAPDCPTTARLAQWLPSCCSESMRALDLTLWDVEAIRDGRG